MNLNKSLLLILVMLMTSSLLLGGCSSLAVEELPTREATAGGVEEPAVEPSAAPTEALVAQLATQPAAEAPTPTPRPVQPPTAEEALTANLAVFFSEMDNYNATTAADINARMAARQAPFLLDVRTAIEIMAKGGYIPGAVIIPLKWLPYNLDRLPTKDTPIVVYGVSETQAAIAAVTLSGLGYSDVKAMVGGSFNGWLAAGYEKAMFTGT